ncbi:hypothetical protein AR688_02695 [Rheinheimera sp. EpRS3]|nr:hypothetical protein AR688_02695 [Rheinheimera sp. EpRS3]
MLLIKLSYKQSTKNASFYITDFTQNNIGALNKLALSCLAIVQASTGLGQDYGFTACGLQHYFGVNNM